MANYNSSATVTLSINGKQASDMLARLQKDAAKLEERIKKAATAGDKATMKKLQKELTSTNKLIDQLTNNTKSVDNVMRRLDKATPRELQKTLKVLQSDLEKIERGTAAWNKQQSRIRAVKDELRRLNEQNLSAKEVERTLLRIDKASPRQLNLALKTLQSQLERIKRGTAAWDKQVAKIKAVKAELQGLNQQLALTTTIQKESLWSRFARKMNDWGTAIMGVVAAISGLVMAGRKAVKSYAEMEEQMANTMKYTRMTAIEVEELNEIFKNMDTRLAREQLNLLAQEGGRLGYNTVASVKEYVEAASIINVALVDLGEGATQTIAKLSNIFGMEQMYGVRDAMLKIGSTVNHLSQNCTAAKPFIVEFAQRMAGIGSTAKMTIPEIMAFAATLDAHGQKVEMSATALQRTIMNLYKKPADMAKKVGLDANKFIETINKSTTEGVMMFLEALNKLGEDKALAVLSPLFQDLGLDGARVSSVLSNLSSHLDFLKWQMSEAAQAFRDGTSASNEYAIFNNTVQAQIDKARKRVGELAIELGEKLYPILKHVYTSSSMFLRLLNVIVNFIVNNKKAIGSLVVVMGAYYGWIVAVKTATALWHGVLAVGKALMAAYRTAIILGRIVVIAFTQGIGAATHAMRIFNAVVKTNPFGLILAAVTAVILAVKALCDRTSEYTKKMREAKNTAANFTEELHKEMQNIDKLIGKLEACEKGTKEYKTVKDEIVKQYGKYLNGLINERGEINNLTAAYNRLAAAARIAAKERSLKTARDTADETHREAFKKLAADLQESLINEGVALRDAVRITNNVVFQLETTGTLSQDLVNELQAIKGNLQQKWGWQQHPVNIVNQMVEHQNEYNMTMGEIDDIERRENPLASYSSAQLKMLIDDLEAKVQAGQGGRIIIGINQENPTVVEKSAAELGLLLDEARARLSMLESQTPDIVGGNPDFTLDDYTPYETEKDRKAREAAERRAAIKEKKEFKDALNNAKGVWEEAAARNVIDYSNGMKSWSQFLLDKYNLELKYFEDREQVYKDFELQEDEDYQELLKKKAEMQSDWLKKNAALKVNEAKLMQKSDETDAQMDYYTPGSELYQKEEALQQRLFEIRIKYLKQIRAAYNKDSEEWYNYSNQIDQAEKDEQLRRQKLLVQRVAEWRKRYEYQEAGIRLALELELLEEAYSKKLVTEEQYLQAQSDLKKKYADEYMPESAKPSSDAPDKVEANKKRELEILKSLYEQGLIDKDQYEKAKSRIEKAYYKKAIDDVRKFGSAETNQLLDIYEAWKNFFDSTEEDGGNWATRLAALASSVFAVMNAGMQQASSFIQAQADLDVANAEKKYDRQIELAEGNTYKVKKLERQKEKEIAKIKNDAARKMYAMQIIQAVAQTATNAINAYGSAAAIPVVGFIMAPIAAAMAVAAGALQIATIKKQQQASQAQGYSKGGFTPKGNVDEPVGIVHAGEWVASQKLVNSPVTRPYIEALDYAQRNNTIGSLRGDDVSRSITAPMLIASQSAPAPSVIIQSPQPAADSGSTQLIDTITLLRERLDEPFVTVNTVSGDLGIKRAQDEYQKLMRNKAPKSKKK